LVIQSKNIIQKMTSMTHMLKSLIAMVILSAAILYGCSNDNGASQDQDETTLTESRGEHSREGGHENGEEGEESGTELSLTESYDQVRNGTRLVMNYDTATNSFIGTVENTTEATLEKVRVEVHLSNGLELGPTNPVDLKPGEKRTVQLMPPGKDFDAWTAHPEAGAGGEEEHGEEGAGEHGSGGEHN
jgi:hypothetical protein